MTPKELYKYTIEKLTKAGVDSPAFEANCIFEDLLGTDPRDASNDSTDTASVDALRLIDDIAARRTCGEPLQYLLGSWEFYGRKFKVGRGVLIPRDDTEVVLRSTLGYLTAVSRQHPPRILDLCSGSGILAITLKCEFADAEVTAVEVSDKALPYLKENAELNNADIKIIEGDVFRLQDTLPDGYYDLIISNPPYIKTEELTMLQSEVLSEPMLALNGGLDGLDFYRHIVPHYSIKLKSGGMLAFELDGDEACAVRALMSRSGFENITIFDDLGGIHRAINGTLLTK